MTAITVLNKGNVPLGPFTRAQVAEKLRSGEFSLDTLAFVEGLSQWTPLRDVLAGVDAAAAPPIASSPLVAPSATAPAYSYAATMQPPAHLVYAGFWIRVAAHILDNLIVSIPFVFIWFVIVVAVVGLGVFQIAQPNSSQPGAPSVAVVGTVIMLYLSLILGRFIAVWLYHAVLESGPHQSTWGKRVMGLKVTNFTGQRISFGHASGRYFSTLVTNMTMGIGYLMVVFTDRKQALHDMIAGTLVVRG
ncbi:MAG TPA: RDD family protein [Candidatus Methylacidiphilales bacterium]|jgi:uncharacterized RDD family membrane protein YckC|nr:RDD family protein [Candidatus Methylacidiphilales bacterium]